MAQVKIVELAKLIKDTAKVAAEEAELDWTDPATRGEAYVQMSEQTSVIEVEAEDEETGEVSTEEIEVSEEQTAKALRVIMNWDKKAAGTLVEQSGSEEEDGEKKTESKKSKKRKFKERFSVDELKEKIEIWSLRMVKAQKQLDKLAENEPAEELDIDEDGNESVVPVDPKVQRRWEDNVEIWTKKLRNATKKVPYYTRRLQALQEHLKVQEQEVEEVEDGAEQEDVAEG